MSEYDNLSTTFAALATSTHDSPHTRMVTASADSATSEDMDVTTADSSQRRLPTVRPSFFRGSPYIAKGTFILACASKYGSQFECSDLLKESLFDYAKTIHSSRLRPQHITISDPLDFSLIKASSHLYCQKCNMGFSHHDEKGLAYEQLRLHVYTSTAHSEDLYVSYREVTHFHSIPRFQGFCYFPFE